MRTQKADGGAGVVLHVELLWFFNTIFLETVLLMTGSVNGLFPGLLNLFFADTGQRSASRCGRGIFCHPDSVLEAASERQNLN